MPRSVEGEGVIGQQPIIVPGKHHQYVSWCNLRTGLGTMHGHYLMRVVDTEEEFQVQIPRFQMEALAIMN